MLCRSPQSARPTPPAYISHPLGCIGTKTVLVFPAGKTSKLSPALTTYVSHTGPKSPSCACAVLAVVAVVLTPDLVEPRGNSWTCTVGRNNRPGLTGTRTSSCVVGMSACCQIGSCATSGSGGVWTYPRSLASPRFPSLSLTFPRSPPAGNAKKTTDQDQAAT